MGPRNTISTWRGANYGLYVLFALAAVATLTVSMRNPFTAWAYEFGVFALATRVWLRTQVRASAGVIALFVISLWGFGQLAVGATAYSWATWNASLTYAGLGATALIAGNAFARERLRMFALRAFVWFALAVTLASVLAHYGSRYWSDGYGSGGEASDAWGPFVNRNRFAVFLELALPVSLWLSRAEPMYVGIAAGFLSAGVASASRAGAVLLVLEAVTVLMLPGRRRTIPGFALVCALLLSVTGAGQLTRRLVESDPFQYRREMARSATAMVVEHPWRGFGLGTFRTVYPAYAEFDAGKTVDHAHNDWLEWAAEGGLLFALAWAVLLLALIRPAIRSVWGLGVLSVFLHATVDYPFERLGLGAWVFLLIGGLLGEKSRRSGALTEKHTREASQEKTALRLETVRSVVAATMAVVMAGSAGAAAASPVIGTVTATGSFRIDRSTVYGNATLFAGSLVETGTAITTLELSSGTVILGAFSEARVFPDHLSLEKGAGEIGYARGLRATGFQIEGRGLMIQPVADSGSARVTLESGGRVSVAAFSGWFRALNGRGLLVAHVAPGSMLEFAPEAPGTAARLTGCLVNRHGHFLITDETTNVVVEVAGPGLQKEPGNRVEITGTMDPTTTPVAEASQFIRVTSVKRISKGCGNRSAAPAGSDGAAGGKAETGGSPGGSPGGTPAASGGGAAGSAGTISATTIAIIGGVAVAAVVGGLAAAGKLPGQAGGTGTISK
jgi:O-antigen ligase